MKEKRLLNRCFVHWKNCRNLGRFERTLKRGTEFCKKSRVSRSKFPAFFRKKSAALDVPAPQVKVGTAEQDATRRDFTMNVRRWLRATACQDFPNSKFSALGLLSKLLVVAYLVVLRICRNRIISDIDFPNAVKQHLPINSCIWSAHSRHRVENQNAFWFRDKARFQTAVAPNLFQPVALSFLNATIF